MGFFCTRKTANKIRAVENVWIRKPGWQRKYDVLNAKKVNLDKGRLIKNQLKLLARINPYYLIYVITKDKTQSRINLIEVDLCKYISIPQKTGTCLA